MYKDNHILNLFLLQKLNVIMWGIHTSAVTTIIIMVLL